MNYFPPGRKSEFDWNGGKAQLSCFSINPQARHCPEDGGTETHKRFSKEDLQMASKPRKDGQYHWSLEKEIEGTRLCPLAPMRTAKTKDSHQRGGERMLRSLEAHPLLWGRKVCWAAQQLLSQIHTEGAEKSRKSGTAQIPTVCWKDKCGSSTWWNIGQQQVKSEALADKLLQSCYWQASSGRSRVVSFRSCEDPDQKRLERQRGMVVTWAGGGAARDQAISFVCDENLLKLDCADDCTTLNILKTTSLNTAQVLYGSELRLTKAHRLKK